MEIRNLEERVSEGLVQDGLERGEPEQGDHRLMITKQKRIEKIKDTLLSELDLAVQIYSFIEAANDKRDILGGIKDLVSLLGDKIENNKKMLASLSNSTG